MGEKQIYGFIPCEDAEFPPEMMVGETVFDCEGKAIGWVVLPEFCEENAKLREAVEKASEIITELCGECPISRYEWLSWDGCAEECKVGKESECWVKYLTGELGVEVDA